LRARVEADAVEVKDAKSKVEKSIAIQA